jgi:hypothetical protein
MAFIDTRAGYGGDIWGANGGGADPGGPGMSNIEAMSKGLLPGTATVDPINKSATLLAQLSNGTLRHGQQHVGTVDVGTTDQEAGGLGSIA